MGRWNSSPESHYEYALRVVPIQQGTDCIFWLFAVNRYGYGVLWNPSGGQFAAHRLAYKIMHGVWPYPIGRHTCHNPRCFNWHHIIPGTTADNVADRVHAERGSRGETHNTTKLTEQVVRQIRATYVPRSVSGKNHNLARQYGVNKTVIQDIINRRIWKHI